MKEEFTIDHAIPLIPVKRDNMNAIFINIDIWDKLSTIKKEIDKYDINEWDSIKKHINDYELIYLSSKNREKDSISSIKPLSRSYFKMVEIIQECNIELFDTIKCGHIAEGPGGFIQAIVDLFNDKQFKFESHAITLKSMKKDVPGWGKGHRFLNINKINIHYGADNTGNLYNHHNIIDYSNKVGANTCDIVTADGGFDYSCNFNKQEEMSYKLLLCEITTNLLTQKIGGTFIIKFFDIFTLLSSQLIYFTGSLYESFEIMKPKTSRIANSEKYIIFKNFKGCPKSTTDTLLEIIKTCKDYNSLSLFEDFETLSFTTSFIEFIKKFNNDFSILQMESIQKTLLIINNGNIHDIIDDCKKHQIKKAIEWCNEYSIRINFSSSYLK